MTRLSKDNSDKWEKYILQRVYFFFYLTLPPNKKSIIVPSP